MKNYLDFTKRINIDDVNFKGEMSPANIMSLFQQAVTEHTLELQLDFDSIRKKHNAKWFIVSARLEIDSAPKTFDTVTVSTWPLKASALKFPRAFVLKNDKGAVLATAMTDWCIVDCDTNGLLRSDLFSFPFDEFCTLVPTSGKSRIPMGDTGALCYERKILASDIDLNRHVNNVAYLRFALDCFSVKDFERINIKSVDMQFKLQCYEGETLLFYKRGTEDGCIIDAKRGEETVFRAKFGYKNVL